MFKVEAQMPVIVKADVLGGGLKITFCPPLKDPIDVR